MRTRCTLTVICLTVMSSAACEGSSRPSIGIGEAPAAPTHEAGSRLPEASAEAAGAQDGSANDVASDLADGSSPEGSQLDGPSVDSSADALHLVEGGGPPAGAPRCDPAHVWSPAAMIASLAQTTFARFGGISASETAIAWTSPTGAIYVADRPQRTQPFSAMPAAMDTTSKPVANDRVALGSTGLQVFAVSADRTSFIAFHRPTVGAPWAASATLQFANIDAMVTVDSGGQFFEPVLSADDNSFFYLLAPAIGLPVLYESRWDASQGVWTTGIALSNSELASTSATSRRRATGASSDGRTLFFYDEVGGTERAAWRDGIGSPFVTFVDTPGMMEAAPNYRCDTLYFQERDGDSSASAGTAAFAQ